MFGRILGSAIMVALAAGPVVAQTKTGTTIGQFLMIEPSARLAGMGNAGVTMIDGLEGVYYNPAAIGRLTRYGVQFSHAAWLADISFDYAAVALPLGHWGTGFASLTALNSGDIDVRTVEQPLGTGERYTVSDIALGVGYGREISERFAAGLQVNFLQETIWHSSVSALAFNIGTLYRVSERGLHVGASISNFGTGASYDGRDLRFVYDNDPNRYGDNSTLPGVKFTEDYAVPVLFRVGLGVPYRLNQDSNVRLALDAFHPSDNTESVSLGAEFTARQMLAVRMGYQNLFLKDSEVGLTAGAGLQGSIDVYAFRLDYAWADQGRLGASHRFSLGLNF